MCFVWLGRAHIDSAKSNHPIFSQIVFTFCKRDSGIYKLTIGSRLRKTFWSFPLVGAPSRCMCWTSQCIGWDFWILIVSAFAQFLPTLTSTQWDIIRWKIRLFVGDVWRWRSSPSSSSRSLHSNWGSYKWRIFGHFRSSLFLGADDGNYCCREASGHFRRHLSHVALWLVRWSEYSLL